jgi:hypothetical protein
MGFVVIILLDADVGEVDVVVAQSVVVDVTVVVADERCCCELHFVGVDLRLLAIAEVEQLATSE